MQSDEGTEKDAQHPKIIVTDVEHESGKTELKNSTSEFLDPKETSKQEEESLLIT